MKRPLRPHQWRKPRMAVISKETSTKINCNCGWSTDHVRVTVRENRAERHLAKRHGGQGIFL